MAVSKTLSNLLPKAYLSRLNDVMTSRGFPWYFLPNDVTYGSGYEYKFGDQNLFGMSKDGQTSCGWTHVLCHDSEPVSQYYDLFIPIVDHIQDRLGCNFNIFRLRLAMLHNSHHVDDYNTPHTDHETKHHTGLFYFHDADGDTVLFDKVDNPNGDLQQRIYDTFHQEYTPVERHKPEANKFVLFDGNRYHGSSNPISSQYRIVLNFNFHGMPDDVLTAD